MSTFLAYKSWIWNSSFECNVWSLKNLIPELLTGSHELNQKQLKSRNFVFLLAKIARGKCKRRCAHGFHSRQVMLGLYALSSKPS